MTTTWFGPVRRGFSPSAEKCPAPKSAENAGSGSAYRVPGFLRFQKLGYRYLLLRLFRSDKYWVIDPPEGTWMEPPMGERVLNHTFKELLHAQDDQEEQDRRCCPVRDAAGSRRRRRIRLLEHHGLGFRNCRRSQGHDSGHHQLDR